jgi:phosphonoacetaldehyde hydrolase
MALSRDELKAVIFDWAGTTIDYGSRAPMQVLIEIFHRRGIEITPAEAREPMGRAKRDHIAAVACLPRVAGRWRELYGHEPTDGDVQDMYIEFLPLQKEVLEQSGSEVIPGIAEVVAELRQRGLKIGSTTGYTRDLMEVVAPIAARGGYSPDTIVCSDDVSAGRPAPWMNFRAAELLDVYPMSAIVVVDDTAPGIAAGRNAGAFTIAVSQTGNSLGLSAAEVAILSTTELEARLAQVEADFKTDGADLVIRSVGDLCTALGIES